MLQKEPELEAVVIALPLHLHAPVAIQCMKAGKHVLCEKLMARTVSACKEMIKEAKETNRILSIGHQRHSNRLYDHATEMIQAGLLANSTHTRAVGPGNLPGRGRRNGKHTVKDVKGVPQPAPIYRDGWFQPILKEDYEALHDEAKLKQYGFNS